MSNQNQLEKRFGVNMGRGTAARIVQKSINFLEIGNPLVVDGLIGPKTFERAYYWGRKDPEAFHKALNGFQFIRYVEIVENITQEKFARGWMKRIQYYREE
jgi:lysozyme family protein